jgi:hypothetical protein
VLVAVVYALLRLNTIIQRRTKPHRCALVLQVRRPPPSRPAHPPADARPAPQDFTAERVTKIQLTVAKYDVVKVVTTGKGWWRVQKDETVGFVPARHLRALARHEEHLYHGGMVWSGPARRKQALELREEELQAERAAEAEAKTVAKARRVADDIRTDKEAEAEVRAPAGAPRLRTRLVANRYQLRCRARARNEPALPGGRGGRARRGGGAGGQSGAGGALRPQHATSSTPHPTRHAHRAAPNMPQPSWRCRRRRRRCAQRKTRSRCSTSSTSSSQGSSRV